MIAQCQGEWKLGGRIGIPVQRCLRGGTFSTDGWKRESLMIPPPSAFFFISNAEGYGIESANNWAYGHWKRHLCIADIKE
ncbi:hypothetical protein KP509_29G064500 [Ceratopteris richardii]|uniref:Uncharacterized protein n=1 Tax=Ceratopteris richardii TaxID=49495 RepID=A0A8T2R8K0_CERRI|nr:hypothetical protein KP509_29G064500 [Ceratopteris richardii]